MSRTVRARKPARRRAAVEALEGRQLLTVAFQPAKIVYQGFPGEVQAGDFTGDGRPDLVIGDQNPNEGTSTLLILPNRGNGTFGAPIKVPGVSEFYSFAVGDFNGDGKLDIAYSVPYDAPNPQALYVLPGRGNGTFGAPIVSPISAPELDEIQQIEAADLNGDGKLDIIFQGVGTGIAVALGRGDGTFSQAAIATDQTALPMPIIGDLNGDGKPDLVLTQYVHGTTSEALVDLGNGDGTFHALAPIPNVLPLAIGDLNGNGRPDLVVETDTANPKLEVLPGLGDGTFGSPTYQRPDGANSAAVADINGDGKPDLVASLGLGSSPNPSAYVTVLAGNGNGTFQPPVDFAHGLPTYPGYDNQPTLLLADLNGDGKPDLIPWTLSVHGGQYDPYIPSDVSVLINTSTNQAPVTVSGRLDPASDTGISHTDALTADATPTFTGQATPGATITLFAANPGFPAPVRIATTTAGSNGSWRATSKALLTGTYTITATAALGGTSATARLLGGSKPLRVVTIPPTITSVALDARTGRLAITFASLAPGGLDRSILTDLAAIALSPGFGRNRPLAVTGLTLSTPSGPGGVQTLVATLAGGRRLGPGPYTLRIAAAGVRDVAGNALDGAFRGYFPSGAGQAGGDFVARFLVAGGRSTGPIRLR